jgi:glucan phosphoethanolaminetransferase (alkaline phosphatase superfamily)
MKSAGRDAVLISNQAMRENFMTGFISAFMEDATRRTYLEDSGHHFDEELIPPLITELEGPGESSKLILVHLSGSHYEYNTNYPEDQAFFTPNSLVDEYLNSIRYTDFA